MIQNKFSFHPKNEIKLEKMDKNLVMILMMAIKVRANQSLGLNPNLNQNLDKNQKENLDHHLQIKREK